MIHAMLLYLLALLRPRVPVTAPGPLRIRHPFPGEGAVSVPALAQGPP